MDVDIKSMMGTHPCHRAPCTCEEVNVDANEGDRGVLSSEICGGSCSSHNRYDILTRAHTVDDVNDKKAEIQPLKNSPNCSHEQEVSSTHLFDQVQAWESRKNVDAVGDDLNNKWIFESGVLEVLSSIIKDEVYAGELL